MDVNVTSTAISPPVELTHLFMNKDGTLDGSRLFSNAHHFFPHSKHTSVASSSINKVLHEVFATKNNTHVSAHSGSTVVLPCRVEKESKFEMVRLLQQQ